jgi:REP element-mobilizing transposase RayT
VGGVRTPPLRAFRPNPRQTQNRRAVNWAFKTVSTKQINIIANTPGERMWQRDFYEHIIRNELEYQQIHHYILDNPREWEKDKFYTEG